MTLPISWPPSPPSGTRSLRVCVKGTTAAAFSENAYMFADLVSANPYTPLPYVRPGSRDSVTVPNTPWGAGRDRGDANPDPAVRASAPPFAQIWCRAITITTGGAALEFSFDGENAHGWVPANSSVTYWDRFESGISVRGAGGTNTFIIEAW